MRSTEATAASPLRGMALMGLALMMTTGCRGFGDDPGLDPEDARYGDRDDDDDRGPVRGQDHHGDEDDVCVPPDTGDTGETDETGDTGETGDSGDTGECMVDGGPVCDSSGHKVRVLDWGPRLTDSGMGTFITYEVCSPDYGMCSMEKKNGGYRSCLDDEGCSKHEEGTCSRECAVDDFKALSNYQVEFPTLGDSCLDEHTVVRGLCTDGHFTLGDGSCHEGGSEAEAYVAKCDSTSLMPGECLEMTLWIGAELDAGEVAHFPKAGNDCNEGSFTGLVCDGCPYEEPDTDTDMETDTDTDVIICLTDEC